MAHPFFPADLASAFSRDLTTAGLFCWSSGDDEGASDSDELPEDPLPDDLEELLEEWELPDELESELEALPCFLNIYNKNNILYCIY